MWRVRRSVSLYVAVMIMGSIVIEGSANAARVQSARLPTASHHQGLHQIAGLIDQPARTFRIPRRISSDGSRDVTKALTAFINSVPDRSTVEFARYGRYRIDGTLAIAPHANLWILGRHATLFAGTPGDQDRRHVRVTGGSNIVIRNLTVVGANPNAGMSDAAWDPAHEFQHGIELDGVQGALLDRVRIHDVYGDFVYVGMSQSVEGVPKVPSRNVTIRNSHFKRNGRMGITVDYAENTLIENNRMGQCRRSWVDVEPNGANAEVRGLTIRDNIVGPHRLDFFANAGQGDNVSDVVISGNRTLPGVIFGPIVIARGDSPVALGGYRGPYLIERNVGPSHSGFIFREAAGITIRDNNMPGAKDVVIQLNDAHTIQVHDNNFTGARTLLRVNDPVPGRTYDYTAWSNKL